MAPVYTGNVCPFPYIQPSALDHHANLTAADCTETYAVRLGAGFAALQAFSLGVPLVVLVVLIFQVLALRRYTYKQHKLARMRDNASFPFFQTALAYNLALALHSVDLYGYHNLYPVEVSIVLDQFVSATLVNVALALVDFWLRCAKFGSREGFPPIVKHAFAISAIINFVVSAIISVADYEHFVAYKVQRSFGGAIILSVFLYLGYATVTELRRTLTSSSSHGAAANGSKADSPSSPSAGSESINANQKRAVKVLTRKLNQFTVVVGIAIIVLIVNGIVALASGVRTGDWRWKIDFFVQPEPMVVVLRVLFLAASLITLAFFKVPGSSLCCLGGGGGDGGVDNVVMSGAELGAGGGGSRVLSPTNSKLAMSSNNTAPVAAVSVAAVPTPPLSAVDVAVSEKAESSTA